MRAAARIREEAYARAAAQAKAAEEALAQERARARADLVEAPPLRHAPMTDTHVLPPVTADEAVTPDEQPSTEPARPRRDPFGPPTSRQAIIDLSSRKRPRNPYTR